MRCVPGQAPQHDSASSGSPALSYASLGSFLPSPALIAHSWPPARFAAPGASGRTAPRHELG